MIRETPRDFLRILRDFDDALDLRWHPTENVWVLYRRSRGAEFEVTAFGSEEPGEWIIDYLRSRDLARRGGAKGYRQWLRERMETREKKERAQRRGAIADAIHDDWRKLSTDIRDDRANQTVFHVQGLKGA